MFDFYKKHTAMLIKALGEDSENYKKFMIHLDSRTSFYNMRGKKRDDEAPPSISTLASHRINVEVIKKLL
jgi:hypothetical protein